MREYSAKTVVLGDSSCAFSIDGLRMLQKWKIPTVNAGALRRSRGACNCRICQTSGAPWRHLVLSHSAPGMLTESGRGERRSAPNSAPRWATLEWITKSDLEIEPLSPVSAILALRPGGYHFFTLTGKFILHLPIFIDTSLGGGYPSGWPHPYQGKRRHRRTAGLRFYVFERRPASVVPGAGLGIGESGPSVVLPALGVHAGRQSPRVPGEKTSAFFRRDRTVHSRAGRQTFRGRFRARRLCRFLLASHRSRISRADRHLCGVAERLLFEFHARFAITRWTAPMQ